MLLKKRNESDELLAMRSLNKRMELTEKEKFRYQNLEKGYAGEVKFDMLIKGLQDFQEERIILNDLLLEVNNSYFQIDSLIISQSVIHLLDVKNYEGDYYLESDNLYSVLTGRENKNPVDQLKRSATLFRQLLQIIKQSHLVEASVVFINPEFTLYHASKDQPIILPTQVNRFLKDFNNTSSTLNDGHKKTAQKLISLHQTKNPFFTLPKYTYEHLRKGIYCKNCGSFLVSKRNNNFVCEVCGEVETIEQAILRNVKEFKLLFPDNRITTQCIFEWCKADLSKRTVSRVLKKNFTSYGNTRETFYV